VATYESEVIIAQLNEVYELEESRLEPELVALQVASIGEEKKCGLSCCRRRGWMPL
jgi:hypothetical protein